MFLHGKPDPRSRSFNLLISSTPVNLSTTSSPQYRVEKISSSRLSPGAQAFHLVPK